MKKKIMFIAGPFILAIITAIWMFYKDGRWYYYRQEWEWLPLLVLYFLFPIFYLIAFLVSLIRVIRKEKSSSSDVFYIASSIIMSAVSIMAFILFFFFTSGI